MSELQINPQSDFPRAIQCLSDGSGVEEHSEKFDLFGRQVKVVSDATRALWSQQLENVGAFESLASLRAEECISEEAFNLLVRNLNEGDPSREGLDGRIEGKDLEFVAKVVLELKGYRSAAEICSQIDRALFLGGVTKLRSLHKTHKLKSGLIPVNSSVERIKTVLAAFAGVRDAMMRLQLPAAKEAVSGDASDSPESPARTQSEPPQPAALRAPEPEARQVFRSQGSGAKEAPAKPSKVAGPTIALVPTGQTSPGGNPIYALQFLQEGRLVGQFRVVSGNASTQPSTGLPRDASLPSSEAEKTGAEESTNPAAGRGAEGTRWFIEARSSSQGSSSGLGLEVDSSSRKNECQGGAGGCVGEVHQEGAEVVRSLIVKQINKNPKLAVDVQ